MQRKIKLAAASAAAALVVGALTSCSSSGGAGTDTGGSSRANAGGSASDSTAALASAQAQITKNMVVPTFTTPGVAFDAKKAMSGKTIYSIPVNAGIDFTQFYAKAAQRIAGQVGFSFRTWQNQGNPIEWGQGIQNAVSQKASLIDLFAGIDPTLVGPQVSQAKDTAIPVVASDTYDHTQTPASTLTASIPNPNSDASRLDADWIAVQTKAKADILFVSSSDVLSSAAGVTAFKDEYGKVCPGCNAKYIDVPSADWATKVLPQVQSALLADPSINYVVPVFDTMSIWASQAITQANRVGKVHIVTYNGTPSILKMMGESDIIQMDVGQSNDWVAHVVLDQEMRVIAGLPTSPNASWPLRIFTKDNLSNTGTPPTDSMGYGDAYKAGFEKLWGLN